MPGLNAKLCEKTGTAVTGPEYVGVESIRENSFVLFFLTSCLGADYWTCWLTVNREMKLICERNDIELAMPQIVVNQPKGTMGTPLFVPPKGGEKPQR